jgi:hydrogenase maturation protease
MRMKIIVLGLGNDLLSDDGIGILAAQRLGQVLEGQADVSFSSLSGLALMEVLAGYDKAILIDAVQTGNARPGSVHELTPDDLGRVIAPSPHYAGIPEMLTLAGRLDLEFPQDIRIYAVEVRDAYTVGGPVSPPVHAALDVLTERVCHRVAQWQGETQHA